MNNWPSETMIDLIAHNGEVQEPTYEMLGYLYRINPVNNYALVWTGKKWTESQRITNEMVRSEIALNKLWDLVKDKPTYNELLEKIESLQNDVLAKRIVELNRKLFLAEGKLKRIKAAWISCGSWSVIDSKTQKLAEAIENNT